MKKSVIRILRVTSDLYPAVVGGIGVHAHEMSKEQVKLGHDVTVYTSGADGRPMREFKDGYKIIRFKSIMKLMGNTFMPGLLFKLMRAKNDFDIIHAHSHLYFSTNLCALVKKLGSPPLVITNHGLFSQTAPLPIQKIYIPTIARWTLRSADRVICYTTEEKTKLEEIGIDSANIMVIHNGIDTKVFTPPEKRQGKTSNQILWIGRFVSGKGVDCLISAFHILVRKNE
ncbi:glycosyltransferase, partial [Dehalococcoidia bacterium]|nr:glycosyltransferase [Dehalococcoidia bacterium]